MELILLDRSMDEAKPETSVPEPEPDPESRSILEIADPDPEMPDIIETECKSTHEEISQIIATSDPEQSKTFLEEMPQITDLEPHPEGREVRPRIVEAHPEPVAEIQEAIQV
jgi:hypothetical protein